MNTIPIDDLETERLILRPFRLDDFDDLANIMGNDEVMRFSMDGPFSREQCREFLEGNLWLYEHRGIGLYAVRHKQDECLIGYCGYAFQNIDSIEEIEIGYRLHPDYWGAGLATEASRAIRNYGFEQLGFTRLISMIDTKNIASIRVAEKNGMTFEKEVLFKDRILVRIYSIHKDGRAAYASSEKRLRRLEPP